MQKQKIRFWLIWARATGHLMGNTDDDKPDVPILTLQEAKVSLLLKTFWVIIHIVTCFFIIANFFMTHIV